MKKQKTKIKKFRGGFAECYDHSTRQRKLKKNKKTPFVECRCCGTRQRD